MIAVPAGYITEGWPESEHQVGRVNVDTEGSVEHIRVCAWAGASRECSQDLGLS